ncbi:hypothetical protein GPECTOR_18g62 [Gonium pectorale]|uniref:Uncharacterized protein n=1 Tax=Gonium pectorale TaxID=33097 RepID=A0A150GK50_GONPE|nr:hypothetical protein GPECTOR_18g62 [Gonium pectorale]|eukprot:KXZ50085.1 hypothetical protein GPECTOR_18g62 [Gonium pectorale]
MFYSNPGPDPEIGGGEMRAASAAGPTTYPFYSKVAGSWEALTWDPPNRPVQAVYTVCSFFYKLEWAPGTVVDAVHPLEPRLTVTTGGGAALVGVASRPLTQPGEFSFTLVPRNCTSECPWYLAQVCVGGDSTIRLVTAPAKC